MDRVGRPCRCAIGGAYGDHPIQEGILRMARLEAQGRPEVVAGGVDRVSTGERGQHLRRAVAHAERRELDERRVAGLERDSQVELEHSIRAQYSPVTAPRPYPPAQP